jgi:hypothetical protein
MAPRYRQVFLEEASLAHGLEGRSDIPSDPAWEPIPYESVASLAATADDFARERGLVFQRTHDDGLGHVDLAVLDLASGARVALARYEGTPRETVVKLLPQQFVNGFRSARAALDSDAYWPTQDRQARWSLARAALDRVQDGVLDELAEALGPQLVRVTWLRPALAQRDERDPPEAVWEVWRQDDAGNRYLVQDRLTEQEARALAARYESRAHKQMYWTAFGRDRPA